jgi:hypothetical protein
LFFLFLERRTDTQALIVSPLVVFLETCLKRVIEPFEIATFFQDPLGEVAREKLALVVVQRFF